MNPDDHASQQHSDTKDLTASQVAMIATAVALQENRRDVINIAQRSGISRCMVHRAFAIRAKGAPELVAAVEQGHIAAGRGAEIAKMEHDKQIEIVQSIMSAGKRPRQYRMGSGTKPGTKPSTKERLDRIRQLAESGHNYEQIANELEISAEHVGQLLCQAGIKSRVPKGSRFGLNNISSAKIITETVDLFTAATRGLEMAQAAGIEMQRERAVELLADLRLAMRPIRWLEKRLKEISHG